jgi:hypothetical protein
LTIISIAINVQWERIWNEVIVAYLTCDPGICLLKLRKITLRFRACLDFTAKSRLSVPLLRIEPSSPVCRSQLQCLSCRGSCRDKVLLEVSRHKGVQGDNKNKLRTFYRMLRLNRNCNCYIGNPPRTKQRNSGNIGFLQPHHVSAGDSLLESWYDRNVRCFVSR